jgi:hypothetical protein
MDPGTILQRGRAAAKNGRFRHALRDYVWFHENALAHDRAYYGVRLSFALSYWMDLAASYPEARLELQKIKERKDAQLAGGTRDHALFHDVARINEHLDRESDTYALFRTIKSSAPEFARECFDVAVNAIVNARDYALAREYWPDAEGTLLELAQRLNQDLHDYGRGELLRREALVYIYCDRACLLLETLQGSGETEQAEAAREWAVALVGSKAVRSKVAKTLYARNDE